MSPYTDIYSCMCKYMYIYLIYVCLLIRNYIYIKNRHPLSMLIEIRIVVIIVGIDWEVTGGLLLKC